MDIIKNKLGDRIHNVPTWTVLSALGKSRIFKSSYFWIVLVPLVAKLFSGIENIIDFEIFGASISINLALPFSWQMFYFSALFIGAASLIYSMFCPEIILKYDKFSDFTDEGKGRKQIISNLIQVVSGAKVKPPNTKVDEDDLIEFAEKFAVVTDKINTSNIGFTFDDLIDMEININEKANSFWWVRNKVNDSKILPRILCSAFYLLGTILLSIVFIENLLFVIKQAF